jgi:hypothetical protein
MINYYKDNDGFFLADTETKSFFAIHRIDNICVIIKNDSISNFSQIEQRISLAQASTREDFETEKNIAISILNS